MPRLSRTTGRVGNEREQPDQRDQPASGEESRGCATPSHPAERSAATPPIWASAGVRRVPAGASAASGRRRQLRGARQRSDAAPRATVAAAERAHRREQDHLADRGHLGEQHHQPVDADPESAGRRQAVFERADVVLVDILGLLVARRLERRLGLEALALIDGSFSSE